MKRLAFVALAVGLFALPACGASPAALATQTAAAATTTAAAWTATPTLTATPLPTATPRPSSTPRPTATYTASPRPSPAVTSTPADGRHVEPIGHFSYVPPIGWLLADYTGLAYKIAYSTPLDGFAPNLIVVDEDNGQPLADYVAATVANLGKLADDMEIISQETFTLTQRLPAVKLVTESTQAERHVRQTFYFFEGWSRKIVATYTRPADQGDRNDALVDAAMASFQLMRGVTPTPVPTTSGIGQDCPDPCANSTVFTFAFPFAPSAPGYLVEIISEDFSAEVLCALEAGETTGRAVDLNDNEFVYGVCDTDSLTLNGVMQSEATLTVILGGAPVVNVVTRGPSRITDYSTNRACSAGRCIVVEYDFTGESVDNGPTG